MASIPVPIIRSCIDAVDEGHAEASWSLGLSRLHTILKKMVCAYRFHSANCCLKRRALHPNALPTWSVAGAGQLGHWVNPKDKLLFGGPKAPLSKGSCRRSRLRGLRQAPKICASRCQEIPAPCCRIYGFAEPFLSFNCLLRIPPLPINYGMIAPGNH